MGRFNSILCMIGLISSTQVCAQLSQQHIMRELAGTNLRTLETQENLEAINIPFWDDFSSSSGQPDPNLWENSENVFVNATFGENPPTLNVATFDGTDATGVPYNIESEFVGNTDNLTSRAIDLSGIEASQQSSVFISFFWQARGNGEIPNETDSLRLQFLTPDSVWVTQFSVIGGETALRLDNDGNDIFTQEIFNVGPEFHHVDFRFRFQAFGRLTGGFDTWHIDYVFLNEGRDLNDLVYFDRGITSPPSSLFGEYAAIPSDQFFQTQSAFVDSLEFELFNLDALPHPIEFTLNIYDRINNVLIDQTNAPTTAPILSGFERRFLFSNTPDLSSLAVSDSIVLETEIIYNTGDQNLIRSINQTTGDTTFFDNVDYKVNDTLRRQFRIQNFLAYDDGTAEFAAGINQIRGRLAYQYFVPSTDTLTDIDIHFPRIATSVEGQPITILVWRRLSDEVGSLLVSQPFTIQQQSDLNQFTRYTLEIPREVRDTIYIGWEQFSDNFIGVGLDKNSNSGNRIFVNVDGEWRRNVGIEGNLMLRPVFRTAETAIITSVEVPEAEELSVYPNPNRGEFKVSGDYEDLRIYNLLGKEIPFKRVNESIRLITPTQGVYLLHFTVQGKGITKRILIRD